MIENAKLFDRLLLEKKLKPIDPDDPVPLYDVDEIRIAWIAYKAECRGVSFSTWMSPSAGASLAYVR